MIRSKRRSHHAHPDCPRCRDLLLNCWRDPSYGQDEAVAFSGCVLNIKLDPGNGEADFKMLRAVRLLQRHLDLTAHWQSAVTYAGVLRDGTRAPEHRRHRSPGSTELGAGISGGVKAIQVVLTRHWSTRTRNIVVTGVLLAVLFHPYVQDYKDYPADTDKAQIAANANIKIAEHTNRTNLEIAKVQADAQVKVAAARRRLKSLIRIGGCGFGSRRSHRPRIPCRTRPLERRRLCTLGLVPWRPALMGLAPMPAPLNGTTASRSPRVLRRRRGQNRPQSSDGGAPRRQGRGAPRPDRNTVGHGSAPHPRCARRYAPWPLRGVRRIQSPLRVTSALRNVGGAGRLCPQVRKSVHACEAAVIAHEGRSAPPAWDPRRGSFRSSRYLWRGVLASSDFVARHPGRSGRAHALSLQSGKQNLRAGRLPGGRARVQRRRSPQLPARRRQGRMGAHAGLVPHLWCRVRHGPQAKFRQRLVIDRAKDGPAHEGFRRARSCISGALGGN